MAELTKPLSVRPIFVSHAECDGEVVLSFLDLVRSAMKIQASDIRCTSVDGCRLPTGVEINNRLKDDLLGATVFVALLTPASLDSDYVLFELGARWGQGTCLLPLLAKGAEPSSLRGPLTALVARRSTPAEMHQLLNEMANVLAVELYPPHAYQKQLDAFLIAARPEGESQSTNTTPLAGYTARDICLELREVPPLQRKAKAVRFVGSMVDWDVQLRDATLKTETESTADCSFIPWEDEGFDTGIYCELDLKSYPELQTAKSDTPFRIVGRIKSAKDWHIILEDAKLFPLQNTGTRVRCLLGDVRRELGATISKAISNREIEASLCAQLNLGRVPDATLTDNKTIQPEIEHRPKSKKLLVLRACKHIIESNPDLARTGREKLFSLETEIYETEN